MPSLHIRTLNDASIRIYGSPAEFVDSDIANQFDYNLWQGDWRFEVEGPAWEIEPMFYDGSLPEWTNVVVTEGTLFLNLDFVAHANFNGTTLGDAEFFPFGSVAAIEGFDFGQLSNANYSYNVHDNWSNVDAADFFSEPLSGAGTIFVQEPAGNLAALVDDVAVDLPAAINDISIIYSHEMEPGGADAAAKGVLGAENRFQIPSEFGVDDAGEVTVTNFTDGVDAITLPSLIWAGDFDPANIAFRSAADHAANVGTDGRSSIDILDDGDDTVINLYQDDDASIDVSIRLIGVDHAAIDNYDFDALGFGDQPPLPEHTIFPVQLFDDPATWPVDEFGQVAGARTVVGD